MPRRAVLVLFSFSLALPAPAAQPQFWRIEEARDFLDGETEGVSIDSEGRLQLAPASRHLFDPDAAYVWSLAGDAKGVLFAGTGNDGRIFRIEGGKGRLLYDAPELEVHALAWGPDGRLYAGTSPDGKVYAIDATSGKADTFFDPADKYIWALAFDASGLLHVATGGEGRVHRVSRDGKGTVLFSSAETHLTALAMGPAGTVYAGSAPGGVLFRIGTDGKVFVLHDSAYREVKAIALGPEGSVYAAGIESREASDTSRGAIPIFGATTTTSTPTTEVTVTESFTVPAAAPTPTASPRPPEAPRGGPAKGGVFRVLASGEVDTLWASSEESPHSLLANAKGVLVGTGNRGKLYQIRDDRTWTMLAAFPGEQLTSLLRTTEGRMALASSNPAKVHEISSEPAARGTFTSKPRDTETVSRWGRVRWEGTTPNGAGVKIETRSGNTATPDTTWTEWASVSGPGREAAITNESARFLQLRVALTGTGAATPSVDTLSAAYLQRNLRPQIQSITVHPPGEVFQKPLSLSGDSEILGLEGPLPTDARPQAPSASSGSGSGRPSAPPAATSYSRKMYQKGLQTFSWRAEDPNADTLTYVVHYRPIGDSPFRLLRKGLTEAVLAWDTSTVPNGRYIVRVKTTDSPGNPEGLALTTEKESVPFDVDNTPPLVTVTAGPGRRVRVVVKDESSVVRRAEYSLDGGRWQDVHPQDGINDATEEVYEIQAPDLVEPGPHSVTVRASDLLGNVATGRAEIP